MSKLYADIESTSRGKTTKKTKPGQTWIRTHTRTWKQGISVHYYYDFDTDEMVWQVNSTGGSNDPSCHRILASGRVKDWR